MNIQNADDCQHIVDEDNLDEITFLCREQDRARSLPANGRAVRDDILAKLDAIEAPAISTGYAVTCNTPTEILTALPPKMAAPLVNFDASGSEPQSRAESAAIRAVREKQASPEAVALKQANKEDGHFARWKREREAHRTGEGRDDYNAAKRRGYASHIRAAEDRAVGHYTHHATDEARADARKEGNAKSSKKRRDNMTPEQKKAESAKASQRRRERKEREAAQAIAEAERQRQAMLDRAIF